VLAQRYPVDRLAVRADGGVAIAVVGLEVASRIAGVEIATRSGYFAPAQQISLPASSTSCVFSNFPP